MTIEIEITATRSLIFSQLKERLATEDIHVSITPADIPDTWAFYRDGLSTTLFMIEMHAGGCRLMMDRLAAYDDYRFLPYLTDTLCLCLNDRHYSANGQTAYQLMDEEWASKTIGDEIAALKCMLALGHKYYLSLPISDTNIYVSSEVLSRMGVSVHSATPRIYGYIQHMLCHDLLPYDIVADSIVFDDEDVIVDVPQHHSIGRVMSWQTDGAETYESFCRQDAEMLLKIAETYTPATDCEGVVLNDIGTLYEHGIGVQQDIGQAIYWYKEAIIHRDLQYAPTSLGDIYRKGSGGITPDLSLALQAYRLSTDPYAWYRIGQSLEEGWTDMPDLDRAIEYYTKAAAAGHHLAIKRLALLGRHASDLDHTMPGA